MTITKPDFDFLTKLIESKSAIVLDAGKEYLIETRLQPLLRTEGFQTLAELTDTLRRGQAFSLERKVIDALTTNESSFFRDLHPFETLRQSVLPHLINHRANLRTLNIWCGACSSGQEPYTIAMILREHFPELNCWNVRILATDISETMLTRARSGWFNQIEVNRGLPAHYLVRYFTKQDNLWKIRDDIRQMVEFREMNLLPAWGAMPSFDLVFMRNVLIYFSLETKKLILGRIANVMQPHGYLILGGAETTIGIDDSYRRILCGKTVFYGHPRGTTAPT